MCGIAGKVYDDPERQVEEDLLSRMCAAMVHRGPDDEGRWTGPGVGLAMRRLQVIDLAGGAQPMTNEDGTLWIVFNGEIYNYRELRRHLEGRGHAFRTHCDTESILHLFEEEGEACLGRLQGMFAVAIWDTRRRRLVLARDRMGQKPLYYAYREGMGLSFASELTALLEDGQIDRQLDARALDEYLAYLFVPHPRTPYLQVRKLPPAACGVWEDGRLTVHTYWRPDSAAQGAGAPPDLDTAADRLDVLVREAVRCRLHADVPLGAFLSGGLDSSLIVAIMARLAPGRVRTFSIGFADASFDETAHARHVADLLGTEHEEFRVGWEVEDLLPLLLDRCGEPFADASAIPTYHLSRHTRAQVTVALSGDGGDEVFGGYRRYQARGWTELYNRVPNWLGRSAFEAVVGRLPEPPVYYGDSLRKRAKRFCEFAAAVRAAPHTSWAFFLGEAERAALYTEGFSHLLSRQDGAGSYEGMGGHGQGVEAMMRFDLVSYLPDDILVKVDRMSMACSLEVRSPFLDHRLVEYAVGLPRPHKVGLMSTKRVLRRLARRYLPAPILRRPKHGFAVPLDAWLRGPLLPFVHEHLLGVDSRIGELVRRQPVRQMVSRHERGERDLSQQLWALLVLELWLRRTGASL